ncbi:hypothetical protein D0T85_15335 [Bacteroides sp. 519]|nr:hypothetical protein [Bacteroides sp. 519]
MGIFYLITMNNDKYSKAFINSALLLIWTELVFFILLFIGIAPLNFNPIGRLQNWIVSTHLFLIVITLLYGILQLVVVFKDKRKIYKIVIFYGLWWIFSIFFCGLLFTYLDMKLGYFVSGDELYSKILKDMCKSFELGTELVFTSFPFNLFVLAFSFLLLYISNFKQSENA